MTHTPMHIFAQFSLETFQLRSTLSVFNFKLPHVVEEISCLKRTRNTQNKWEISPAHVGVAVDATVAVSLRTFTSSKNRHLLLFRDHYVIILPI